MKIVCFAADKGLRLGVVDSDEVIDLQAADPNLPADLGEVLRGTGGDLTPLSDLAKKAPASARRPLEGLTYALPVAFPSIFFRVLTSMVPHLQPIVRPRESIQLDYEAELVAIVGKRAKHLTLDNALDCIVGFSCANEGSVREFQRHTTQWGMGKNFDRTGGFGPWMVSADELPRGARGLKIMSRLNGNTMQSDNTENMMFPLPETLVYLTKGITLEPGDVILTGTPSGVGHARKPEPVWMKAGDTCEIEVEGVGTLRNPIEDEKA
jgi:acylpyruvate hydrolase